MTCPQCSSPVDFLDIQQYDLRDIHPDRLFSCPNCQAMFWPENGFLTQLDLRDPDVFFGSPLSLGSTSGLNATDVKVGRSREFERHQIDEGYVIESAVLRGIKPDKSDIDLEVRDLDGAYTRASLGNEVLVSVVPTGDASVVLNATIREGIDEPVLETGDKLNVQYRYVKSPEKATNPPWIDLLTEASLTIRRKNTYAMYLLLVAAMDNFLYWQCLFYYRWDGYTLSEAQEEADSYGGNHGPNRYNIVEDVFSDLGIGDLTDSRYEEEWEWFCDMNDDRNDVVHPDADLLREVDRTDAIQNFNKTMDLIVKIFNHIWYDK